MKEYPKSWHLVLQAFLKSDSTTHTVLELLDEIGALKLPRAVNARPSTIQLINGAWQGIEPEMLRRWRLAAPALNIDQELSKAAAWATANPKNTKKNWERFLVNWFNRSQDRAGRAPSPSYPQKSETRDRPMPPPISQVLREKGIDLGSIGKKLN